MRFNSRVFIIVSLAAAALMSSAGQAQTIKFARYPHICQGKIAFTYQDDIWVANDDGSQPRRLTHHVARDIYPRFSPDGQSIAFCSDRMGNYDIYRVPVTGGTPTQLTCMTDDDITVNWTPDGKRIIFRSLRDSQWDRRLYTISCDGDIPVPLNIDAGYSASISLDGQFLAFNRKNVHYGRKHYKGNDNADIWLQDLNTQQITQLTDTDIKKFRSHVNDRFPMWGADGRIYYASERDDIFNLWSLSPQKPNPRQLTCHTSGGVQYPAISPDGTTIIYENEFDLWKVTVPDGTPEKIDIQFTYEPKENMTDYIRVNSQAEEFTLSPNGEYAAVATRGEIFIVPTDPEKGEKTQVTDDKSRDKNFAYSPDGKYLSYVSDRSGDEEIWLYNIEERTSRQLTKHASTKARYLWAEDSKKIVWVAANTLFITDVETAETEELAHNDAFGFYTTDISKDGQWIVYHRYRDDNNQDIYLFNVKDRQEFNVSQNPFYDYNGMFSDDEQSLVFTSKRNNGRPQLYVVPFEKITEDKNDPLLKILKEKEKDKEKENNNEESAADDPNSPDTNAEADKAQPEEKPTFKLDMDDISRRAILLTKTSRSVEASFVIKDKVYYTAKEGSNLVLFSVGIDGEKDDKVSGGNFGYIKVSADNKTVIYKSGSNLYTMSLSAKKEKRLTFSYTFAVEKQHEWNQIFGECWRVMKYYFYDENMHGYDWDAIKTEYQPLLPYLSSYQDVYDLANLMIGELNASHTGVSGPTRPNPSTYKTQLLGFEMVPDGDVYKVSHIYWNGPADKEWIDLNVGDCVLSLNGHTITPPENYWPILNRGLNEYVTVEVASAPNAEDKRSIRIKTVTSLTDIKYDEWVEKNRRYVKEKTNDTIAYVHIRGMKTNYLEQFKNEIDRYYNHKGIIIDIRYNSGGNIDQQLLDILARRPYEYWNDRWASPEMGRRPRQAINGPKIMMINARSASNSEVTPLGFRDLGLGTVVGTPTAGAVIATRSYTLINGATIRRPGGLVARYDPTQPNNFGTNLENYGVEPDVWVENTPNDELNGIDRELDAAIEQAMKMLKKQQEEIKSQKKKRFLIF